MSESDGFENSKHLLPSTYIAAQSKYFFKFNTFNLFIYSSSLFES